MPVNYALLTTQAMCDAATAEIDFKLLTYTTRDAVDVLADTRAERSQSSTSARLAAVNSKITAADILLTTAGIDPALIKKTTDDRAALLVQRTTLTNRSPNADGLNNFLGEVEDEEVDTQVAALTAIKTGIATHRDTLAV